MNSNKKHISGGQACPKQVDLFLFMGQSNMAGRGITCREWPEEAPAVIDGAGYEFRAVSDPAKLYPISEPFGVNENKTDGINDGSMKTGSMVSAFVNAYYTRSGGIPIVAVSASKGGSTLAQWQPGSKEGYLTDAIGRLAAAVSFLDSEGFSIRHRYMLWCQGESDGDTGTSEQDFKLSFRTMLDAMLAAGLDKLFMVRIGNCNVEGDYDRYRQCIKWETEIAQTDNDVVMVSCDFAGMRERGLMKDNYHYFQAGYNECGYHAGINAAYYVNHEAEPSMPDSANGTMYCPQNYHSVSNI